MAPSRLERSGTLCAGAWRSAHLNGADFFRKKSERYEYVSPRNVEAFLYSAI
jgi:hypothetical protein